MHLDIPLASLDIDAERGAPERRVCAAVEAQDCAILDAIDRADGAPSDPPALPVEMPRADSGDVTVEGPPPPAIEVTQRLQEQRVPGELAPGRFVPLAGAGLDALDPGLVKRLSEDRANVVFVDDSLTLDLPAFDVAVGAGVSFDEEGASRPADEGTFIARTELRVQGEADDRVTLFFAEGGTQELREALAQRDAWIELRIPVTAPIGLRDGETSSTWQRPGGTSGLVLVLELIASVAVAELLHGDARTGEAAD